MAEPRSEGRSRICAAGEMADRVRAFEWSSTPIGSLGSWSERLRGAVETMLAAPQLASLAVGPDRIFLYNDEASRHYGPRHPDVLGLPLSLAFPHEFEKVAAFYDRVFAGESLHIPAQDLDPAGAGSQELFDAYLTPIRGADGEVIAAHMAGFAAGDRLRAEALLRASEANLARELANTRQLQEVSGLLIEGEDNAALHDRILDAAMAIMRADFASLQVVDSATDELRLLSHRNFHPRSARFWERIGMSTSTSRGVAFANGGRVIWKASSTEDADELEHYRLCGIGSMQSSPLTSRDGRLIGMLSTHWRTPYVPEEGDFRCFDILVRQTADAFDRSRIEAASRESEERLRHFGEASQDVLWIRDADTLQWVYLTPAFETIYGLSREEALRGNDYRGWLDVIVPEDREPALASIAKVRAGEHVTSEFRIRRPIDGAIRWLRNTDFPIADGAGKVVLIGGIGHDFTEVREAELRLTTLVGGIPQLVWRGIDGGEWTWASPQWTAFTAQADAEYRDWGWLTAIHPDDRAEAMEAWSRALEHGGFEVEHRLRRHDGAYRWFQTRAAPVRDQAGTIIEWLGTSTDIHDLRELQNHQRVLVAELQHRTRNLITVVRSMADKTSRTSSDLTAFRDRFHGRLASLARVQGLLSRLKEDDRVAFDELVATEFAAMNGASQRVTLDGPSGVRLRSTTVQTLAMALHELATNAVKYGALGQAAGRLHIRWSFERAGAEGKPWLHIDWRESGVAMPPAGSAALGSGQGRELIEQALPYQLSAKTAYTLGPDGVHCAISIPVSVSNIEEEDDV